MNKETVNKWTLLIVVFLISVVFLAMIRQLKCTRVIVCTSGAGVNKKGNQTQQGGKLPVN